MARALRETSCLGIYHVMLRGINRQVIFEDEEDFCRFRDILQECKEISGFKLYAYCLMSNHVHLLIKVEEEPLELIFRRIGCRFVYWYNTKYERVGHLFQDRFRSEVIKSSAHFLRILRYIIQNPMNAGIEPSPGTFPWSSYGSYLGFDDHLTDTDYAGKYFRSRRELILFLNQPSEDKGMDVVEKPCGITDERAGKIMRSVVGVKSSADFQKMDKSRKILCVKKLKENRLSMGQIARLTGMSKTTVFRYLASPG